MFRNKLTSAFFLLIISVVFQAGFAQTIDSLKVYPNPVAQKAYIDFKIVESDTITLEVFNITGEIVRTYFKKTVLPAGYYKIEFLANSLQAGIYLASLASTKGEKVMSRFIVMASVSGINEISEAGFIYDFQNRLLKFGKSEYRKLEFYSANGNLMKSIETTAAETKVEDLQSGIYILKIYDKADQVLHLGKIFVP